MASLGCCDKAGANNRVSRDAEVSSPAWWELLEACEAHGSHHITEETLSLRSRLLPRTARAIGSVAIGGIVGRFREGLMDYFEKHVERYTEGAISEEDHQFNDCVRQWGFPVRAPLSSPVRRTREKLRHECMKCLPNGAWKHQVSAADPVVPHFCTGEECCVNVNHTRDKFKTYVVPSMVPMSMVTVSQHRCHMRFGVPWEGVEWLP
jgi:hypothetical protein